MPYAFDSAFTLTVPAGGEATGAFEIVRHVAKEEAPLSALVGRSDPPIGSRPQPSIQPIITTIAELQFFGKDLAGNDVVATGNIGINFGDFADPD